VELEVVETELSTLVVYQGYQHPSLMLLQLVMQLLTLEEVAVVEHNKDPLLLIIAVTMVLEAEQVDQELFLLMKKTKLVVYGI
tara:strand:+ start:652 stop:900 length:249 start_codon:yes stop_codon:yes gene_type:complete